MNGGWDSEQRTGKDGGEEEVLFGERRLFNADDLRAHSAWPASVGESFHGDKSSLH